jgi:hypothetical protein
MRFAGPTLGPTFARRLRRTSTDTAGRFGALCPHPGDDPHDHRSALIARDRLSALAICAIQDFLCGRDSRLIALRFKGEPGNSSSTAGPWTRARSRTSAVTLFGTPGLRPPNLGCPLGAPITTGYHFNNHAPLI